METVYKSSISGEKIMISTYYVGLADKLEELRRL